MMTQRPDSNGARLNTDHMGNPGLTRIFVGSNGIRAGWRLLVFAAIIVGLLYGKLCLYAMLHVHAPSPADKLIFPGYDAANAAFNFMLVVMATLTMSKIERRPFHVYGLPWRNVLRSRIWAGMLGGFAIVAFVLLCVFAWLYAIYTDDRYRILAHRDSARQ
jgi:uncharacterized protein